MKKSIAADHLLKNLPHQLIGFYEHLTTLDYFTDPDYEFLFSCLHSIIEEYEIEDDEPFDWIFGLHANDIRSRSKSMEKKDHLHCRPRSQTKSHKQMIKVEDYESENAITKYTDASAHTEDIMIDQFQSFLEQEYDDDEKDQKDNEQNDPSTVHQFPKDTAL
uniref:Uncharacterized protein n=1 Tax=Romanomermis culicivorax TaxID=13658 RepID=A0A915K4K8_ROMCU